MNVDDAYTQWSSTYDSDSNLTRDLDELVTRQVLAGQAYHTILELGCGTGKNTQFLVDIGQRIIALDFSVGMMLQARAKIQRKQVLFGFADFTQPLPCAEACANLAVCNLVLEHISDLDHVFAEVYRTLVNGGKFFVCELHPAKQYKGGKAVFTHAQQQIVEITAFTHHISDFIVSAEKTGFTLRQLREWWHDTDDNTLSPRLISFMFEK